MLGADRTIIGWTLTILFAPVLIYRHIKGEPVTPEYYPPKAELVEQGEVYATCGFCAKMRMHFEVVWLMPYTETRECSHCGTIEEIVR